MSRLAARPALAPAAVIPVAATAAGLLLGAGLVAASGASVGEAIGAFWEGMFGSTFAVGASINRAVALTLVGLGFILANRANLTNVGGEGQLAVGGIASTALALHGAERLPLGLAVAAPLAGAALAGALWGALAGALKVRRGTNEVISTLLLSFIGLLMVYWAVQSEDLLRQPVTSAATLPESLEIPARTRLPTILADPSSPLHIGVLIAALASLGVGLTLGKSASGVRLRAVGLNELAARRAGIRDGRLVVAVLAVAGAFGGVAGAIMMQGELWILKAGFTSGYGFDGLVVGLLARGSAAGVVAGALLFGFLRSGGLAMEITAGVPAAVVVVTQGLIVIVIAGSAILMKGRE
ncbi:MAG: ABC transporter permease [Candidatus Rokuibacteriota bacterium]|nr:MAG: ABC transporter permease [Candidatus Rokubacteria bacterium]